LVVIIDILTKVKLSVQVIRYLGTSSSGMNPLEVKEYEAVNERMKERVHDYEIGRMAI